MLSHIPDLPAIGFLEGLACFILLILFFQLARGFPQRFLRIWMTGWLLFTAVSLARPLLMDRNSPPRFFLEGFAFCAMALLLAAVLDFTGRGARLRYLWPLGLGGVGLIAAERFLSAGQRPSYWLTNTLICCLAVAAGWILLRARERGIHAGIATVLLAGAFLLRGLHGLDRPDWPGSPLLALRLAFEGLLGVAIGFAMAVLVLEVGRLRAEELNQKLRRLTLISATATESTGLEAVLRHVLRYLLESVRATHGAIRLVTGEGSGAACSLAVFEGLSPEYLDRFSAIALGENWIRRALALQHPWQIHQGAPERELRRLLEAAQLATLVVMRIPGHEGPIGLLELGTPILRDFNLEEQEFLTSVANLLGLTIRNIRLFEELSDLQRQWGETFDSVGDLILVHNRQGQILRVNERLAQILSSSTKELFGKSVREVVRHGSSRWTLCPYCEGVEGTGAHRDPTFDGYWVAMNSALHNSAGDALGTIHVLKDMSGRREAELQFRQLFENMQEGVFVRSPDGQLLDCNDVLLRLLGFENRAQLLGTDFDSIYVDSGERERAKRLLREHGRVQNVEFRFRRRDGEVRMGLESSFFSRDQSANVVSHQGFILDVTEQRQAELEIRRRNRELMALNAISQILGQSLDLNEILNLALPRIAALFAADTLSVYLLDEVTLMLRRVAAFGQQSELARAVAPVQVDARILQQLRNTGARVISGMSLPMPEVLQEVAKQEKLEVIQVAILWSKERILGALAIGFRHPREFAPAEQNLLAALGNDLAASVAKSLLYGETRQAYDNLRLAQEQLLQSEKMAAVGQLISGVAHELNNPLAAILGYAELLSSSEGNARSTQYVEKIQKQAQRTHHIVQNLLSFSRQHRPERTRVQVNQILEDTLALREYDLRRHRIELYREFDPQLPATSADPHQLQQVFLNILNNAVDAVLEGPEPRRIWVRTAAAAGSVIAEFTNSGPDVADTRRIFDPFYTTKPVGKGTGLGLSICYGIVKEHGGEIYAVNAPPRGACFHISLPIRADGPEGEKSQSVAATAKSSSRVLIVDDEDRVLELEEEILKSHGLAVNKARSVSEAIAFLERHAVDAVVTKLKMPDAGSAEDFFQWVEQRRPALMGRVLFTFSDGEAPSFESLRARGCPSIRKPFAGEEFWQVVRQTLAWDVPNLIQR